MKPIWCILLTQLVARSASLQAVSVVQPSLSICFQDVDDALCVKRLGKDKVELSVHIADVSHFVTCGSATDLEAAARCTTVYLCDRR